MIITERFVFIHMHKTGGQTLNEIIKRNIPEHQEIGYHYPVGDIPAAFASLPVVGMVRNPWDWYISWYAFNNSPKLRNPLFAIVSNNGQENVSTTIRNLINLGSDSELSRQHRQQLISVLPDSRLQNRGVGLTKTDIRNFNDNGRGYYSWLCLRMLGKYDSTQSYIGKFENLEQDFINIMNNLGVKQAAAMQQTLKNSERKNSSEHSHYSHYYDNALRQLVADKEQELISHFKYKFEPVGPAETIFENSQTKGSQQPFKKLLGRAKNYLKIHDSYDVSAIKKLLSKVPKEKWRESGREKRFDIHRQTEALLLVKFEDFRFTSPEFSPLYHQFRDVTQPVVEHIAKYYQDNGFVVRMIFAKLLAGGKIPEHKDTGYSLLNCHRIHIPIVTNDKNEFFVGGEPKKMRAGEFWEINNADNHSVDNQSDEDRIHLIIDWLPNPEKKPVIETVLSPEQNSVIATQPIDAEELNLMVADAYQMHKSGRVQLAKSTYRTILDFDPKHPLCNNLLGLLCLQTGEFKQAIEYITAAISTNPNDAQAHANLGIAFKEVNQVRKAILHFQQSLKLAPNKPSTLNNLGNMHKELGEFNQAIACYRQALTLQPNHPEACHNLGSTLLVKGNYAEAVVILKRAIELNPSLQATRIELDKALKALE